MTLIPCGKCDFSAISGGQPAPCRRSASVGRLLGCRRNEARAGTPYEEVEAFLHENDYHFEMIETETPDLDDILNISAIRSTAGRLLARNFLETYQMDATALPLTSLMDDLPIQTGLSQLAQKHHCTIPQLMRRLACLPTETVGREFGMVSMDVTEVFCFANKSTDFTCRGLGQPAPIGRSSKRYNANAFVRRCCDTYGTRGRDVSYL